MKKIGFLLTIICCCILLTGCKEQPLKKMTCTRTATQEALELDFTYTAEYRGNYVTKVESTEIIKSDNAELLEQYKESVESTYSIYDNIDYYTYNVEVKDDQLISKASIDYENIDTDKLIEIDSANGNFIKDGKVNIEDLKSLYEQIGATCDK